MTIAVDAQATPTQASTTTTQTISLTTTKTAAMIVVIMCAEVVSGGTALSVSSVTATGLSFSRRSQNQFILNSQATEVWWATASSTFSGTITGTWGATIDDAAMFAFDLYSSTGASLGWDGNASVPATVHGSPGDASISTNSSAPYVFAATGTPTNADPSGPTPVWFMTQQTVHNGGGTNFQYASWGGGLPGSALSSTTVGWSTAPTKAATTIDAVTETAAASPYVPPSRRSFVPQIRASNWRKRVDLIFPPAVGGRLLVR